MGADTKEGHTMDAAAELREIESIKQLKARYCRYLDTKDWPAWRTIFTDDFVSDTAEAGGRVIVGATNSWPTSARRSESRPSPRSSGARPEIELLSETTARGVWALEDVVRLAPGVNLNGYGHYHETYEKTAGQWQIKTSKLTRLREDIFNPVFSLRVSQRLRDAGAKVANVSCHREGRADPDAKHPRPRGPGMFGCVDWSDLTDPRNASGSIAVAAPVAASVAASSQIRSNASPGFSCRHGVDTAEQIAQVDVAERRHQGVGDGVGPAIETRDRGVDFSIPPRLRTS